MSSKHTGLRSKILDELTLPLTDSGELGGERGGGVHADLYSPGGGAGAGPHLLHPALYDVMHPTGPLAMVAPLHPFDTSRQPDSSEGAV